MDTREQREKVLREEHEDWSDEQVNAELDRQEKEEDPPKEDPPDDGKDKAMARLRREKNAAEKAAKAAQDKLDERDRKEAEEQGKFKELAETARKEADQAAAKLAQLEQRQAIEKVARKLKFRHPDEAIAHPSLPDDLDRTDEAAVEAALKALAENRPHLVDDGAPGPSGGPGGGPPPTTLTRADVEAMSEDEINERWDEVQKVLAK